VAHSTTALVLSSGTDTVLGSVHLTSRALVFLLHHAEATSPQLVWPTAAVKSSATPAISSVVITKLCE